MGCNLNDRNLVRALTEEALFQAKTLEKFGAKVNWNVPAKPHEPQMRYPRSLFVPGKEVLFALRRQIKKHDNISLLEDCLALRLLTVDGEAAGALLLDIATGTIVVCESKATILATGSLGEIYTLTAQEPMGIPTGSSGSGYVLAGQAGADLVDMEMIQFVVVPIDPPLIKGMRCLPWAPLKNAEGRDFLDLGFGEYSHQAAQAVYREIKEGRGPLTMHLPDRKPPASFRHPLFGKRHERLHEYGVTPYQRPITVGLGALFMMGGVHINERCETTVPGLYAAGEAAANVHGARRVAGNAFPDMIVFGARAGKYAALEAGKKKVASGAPKDQINDCLEYLSSLMAEKGGGITARELRQKIKSVMEQHAHAIRNASGLKTALEEIEALEKEAHSIDVNVAVGLNHNAGLIDALDCTWMAAAARIVCRAALLREESRGYHFREDFPEEKDSWLQHTVVRRKGEDWIGDAKPIVT
jgi:succinate dehydrogenase/fumarate reductase flavoprotein subunit